MNHNKRRREFKKQTTGTDKEGDKNYHFKRLFGESNI